MTEKKNTLSRRAQIRRDKSIAEQNVGEPMEIAIGGVPKIGLAQQIQEQIAIQMAKKTPGKPA